MSTIDKRDITEEVYVEYTSTGCVWLDVYAKNTYVSHVDGKVYTSKVLTADEARKLRDFLTVALGEAEGKLPNLVAEDGVDRCYCGCKYWSDDKCIDCGTHIGTVMNLT